MRQKSFLALALSSAILGFAGQALAHVHLVSSTPGDKSTAASPTEITMRFNGPLVSRVSAIKLVDSRGGEIAATLQPSSNKTEIVAKPEQPLSPGIYRITWTAAGEDDGHRMSGNISFTVK